MGTATVYRFNKHWLGSGSRQLERLLQRYPATRTVTLLLIHVAGCLVMLAAPVTLVAAAGGAFYLYFNIQGPLDWFLVEVLGALSCLSAWLCLQLSRLQLQSPAGVVLTQKQAPELFASLARRVAHFRMRPVREVILTTEAELRITAVPGVALPIMHRYTLQVGAPAALFLSRGQFGLALAGAVAAAAEQQSQLQGQLVQASDDWSTILEALRQRNNLLARLLSRPLGLVAELTGRLSEPLRQDWLLQQGRWLRDNSDEETVAGYLANMLVAEAFMQRQYWPMILKSAERCPTPVVKAFSHLPLLLDKTLNQTLAERWLLQAQTAGEAPDSRVRDLLAELRIDQLHWTGLPHPKAFGALLHSLSILKQLDTFWQTAVEPEWRERHARFQDDQTRFLQLHKRAAETGLRDESALRYIKLCARFLKPAEALSACHQVYAGNGDDPRVCFAAGLAMLRLGDGQEGIQALQRAAELDPALLKRSNTLIREHRQAWVHQQTATDAGAARSNLCA